MQDLVDTIRNHEAEGINASYPYIVKASGKENLGGGVLVGITVELQNTKIKFADRPGLDWVICNVTGGNLVAVDDVGVSMEPTQTSDYVTIVKTSSSSATIATLEIDNLQRMVESMRGTHGGFGNIWYWDPVNGNDAYDGASPTTPVQTFAQAHTLATDNNHDIIFAIPGETNGQTVSTEKITISKNYLFLRGPGKDFMIKPITTGTVVTVTGDGVEVSGMMVEGCISPDATDDGVYVTGDHFLCHQLWGQYAGRNGIRIVGAEYATIEMCDFEFNGACGIHIEGVGADETQILNTRTRSNGNCNIMIGSGAEETVIKDCTIHDAAKGIWIKPGALHTYIFPSNEIANVGTKVYNEGGSTNYYFEEELQEDTAKIIHSEVLVMD